MQKINTPKDLVSENDCLIVDSTEQKDHNHLSADHYHGVHHIDKYGNHDDVETADFELRSVFQFSKRKLIFKIVLTGIFLALTSAVGALDILLESIHIPVGGDQVWIETRFLDITVVCISIATLGPIFASLVGFLSPIIHNLIHGMEHGWIQPPIQAVEYVIIVWLVFLIFNVLFKNSPIHKDQDPKVANFKRWAPLPIMVVLSALIATLGLALALYIQSLLPHGSHSHSHDHNHGTGEQLEWNNVNIFIMLAVFGWNCLRFFIALSLFTVIEWKMRPINHRYR
ncbi:ECF transporter S component [Mycoplasma putrefaciens]|uniref:ECF transporter S component n=1 Tax=Mycoplasma putrefaciens TaxID=2123 RepID=UPI003DA23E6B